MKKYFPVILIFSIFLYLLLWHISLFKTLSYPVIFMSYTFWILGIKYWIFATAVILLFCGFVVLMEKKSRRKTVFAVSVIFVFIFFISLLMRCFDWVFFYYGGIHVDSNFWMYLTAKESLAFINIPLVAGLILFFGIFTAAFAFAIRKLIKWCKLNINREVLKKNIIVWLICLILINIVGAGAFRYLMASYAKQTSFLSFGMSAEKRFLKLIPEIEFIGSFFTFYLDVPEKPLFGNKSAAKMNTFGLYPDINSKYPFMKKSIRISNTPSGRPSLPANPNIILIAFESLSSCFTEYSDGKELLMPHVRKFIDSNYSFPNMTNSGAPTLNGLIAILGSSVFIESSDINDFSKSPVRSDFLFINEVLKKHGYSSIHVQGCEGSFSNIEQIMRKNGYDEFYSPENPEVLAHAKLGAWKWGLHDEDTFAYAQRIISERRKSNPFFLSISTIEAHFPYTPPEIYGDGKDGLLSSMRSADTAFGHFMEYFQKSSLKNNTILIITADHAIQSLKNQNSLPDAFGNRYPGYDRIPLAIYLPGNRTLDGKKNPVPAGELDITPTILDMLGIDTKNSFMGISLFSDAAYRKMPFGKIIFSWGNPLNGYTAGTHWKAIEYIRYLDFHDLIYSDKAERSETKQK
jgi:phosphoglycerol transferase MdoB-like AlkP superfamily enzyme